MGYRPARSVILYLTFLLSVILLLGMLIRLACRPEVTAWVKSQPSATEPPGVAPSASPTRERTATPSAPPTSTSTLTPIPTASPTPTVTQIPSATPTLTPLPFSSAQGDIQRLACLGPGVSQVAFSPDNRWLAVASDHVIYVYDRRKLVNWQFVLAGPQKRISRLAFSPDSNLLASGSSDGAILLWDLASGNLLQALPAQSKPIDLLAFWSDGQALVSVADSMYLTVWDLPAILNPDTPRSQWIRKANRLNNLADAISPDGHTLALAWWNNLVIWDIGAGRQIQALDGLPDPNGSMAFSPDGKTFAAASSERVTVWDIESNQITHAFFPSAEYIEAVAFSPDGQSLAVGAAQGSITLWDIASEQQVQKLKLSSLGYRAPLTYSPDGQMLAVAEGYQGLISFWDVTSGELLHEIGAIDGERAWFTFRMEAERLVLAAVGDPLAWWDVLEILAPQTGKIKPIRILPEERYYSSSALAPDGQTLAFGTYPNGVVLWDRTTNQELITFDSHASQVYGLTYSPDGRVLAGILRNNTVILWDVAKREELQILSGHMGFINRLTFSPDGRTLASESEDKTFILWDLSALYNTGGMSSAPFQRLLRYPGKSIMFSPDSMVIASIHADHTITLWEAAHLERRQVLSGHLNEIAGIMFSPDGAMLASADRDGVVMLWDAANGQQVWRAVEPASALVVAFSPDGAVLAVGLQDGTLTLREADSGELRQALTGHLDGVTSLAFSPDGLWLASGSLDDSLLLWGLPENQNRIPFP